MSEAVEVQEGVMVVDQALMNWKLVGKHLMRQKLTGQELVFLMLENR